MAATAKKGQNVYAPSRVYSYSRAATAEKLPYEEAESIPAQIPRAEPKRHAAPQTRIMREATTAQKRKQRTLPKLISVTGVLMIAAVMIGLVFRYASIASAYRAVNSTQKKIEEKYDKRRCWQSLNGQTTSETQKGIYHGEFLKTYMSSFVHTSFELFVHFSF